MLIVNPIYDYAFKYLMDDNQMAKTVLNIILETKIEQLQMQNVETPIFVEGAGTISRYDFKAVIRNQQGESQKVLIELQKYKALSLLPRFREYLGQNYQRTDRFINAQGEEQSEHLPIISVYLLGYDLPEFETRFIKIDNQYIDGISRKEISDVKSEFAAILTHKTYILLVGDKPNYQWQGTRIEAFIRLFRQKQLKDAANKEYELEEIPKEPEIKAIAEYLNRALQNETLKRQIDLEDEQQKTIKRIEEEIKEERRQKEEERRQKEEERRQKEEAEAKVVQAEAKAAEVLQNIRNAARIMKANGLATSVIAQATGLSKEEIEKL